MAGQLAIFFVQWRSPLWNSEVFTAVKVKLLHSEVVRYAHGEGFADAKVEDK